MLTQLRIESCGHSAQVLGRVHANGRIRSLVHLDGDAILESPQLLESLPTAAVVDVHVEVAHPDARLDLPDHPGALISWHDLPAGEPTGTSLLEAVRGADFPPGTRVWAAAEAAAVQRIRRHLFEERGLERSAATVRGYWKHGRDGT